MKEQTLGSSFPSSYEAFSAHGERTRSNVNWGEAISISSWYGREHELVELERWIIDERCRLIGVMGMGGMGKTALTIKLMQRAQVYFDHVVWLSLYDAPSLEVVVTHCLRAFSGQQEHLPQELEQKLTLFMECLRATRCLVVLDNLETILQGGESGRAGHYLRGYEAYGRFLLQVGEAFHTSCLIITSREKPAALKALGAVERVQGEEVLYLEEDMQEDIHLTRREQDILRFILDGYNNHEIAQALYVSKAAIKTHINHVFTKLGVQDRAQAVTRAQQLRLLP